MPGDWGSPGKSFGEEHAEAWEENWNERNEWGSSVAALDDLDHLVAPVVDLDDLDRRAFRTEDDDVEMRAMIWAIPAIEIVEVTAAGFGDGGKRNGGDDSGDGSECKLFHDFVPSDGALIS